MLNYYAVVFVGAGSALWGALHMNPAAAHQWDMEYAWCKMQENATANIFFNKQEQRIWGAGCDKLNTVKSPIVFCI